MGLKSLLGRLLGGTDRKNPEAAPPRPTPLDMRALALPERPDAPLFDRLPHELGDHLVCLEMKDGRVKAHTLAGSIMLPLGLKDAIAELGGIEGLQVHRSWWVARENVRAIRREGRAIKLELANGLLAPVARNRQEALRREGWL
jgi:DNA-binding LytR/AlgR family response regulator